MSRTVELILWIIFTIFLFFWGVCSLGDVDYDDQNSEEQTEQELSDYLDLEEYGKNCSSGDDKSCAMLKKQLQYSRSKCDLNDSQGCFYLGYQLDMGYGVEEDNSSAIDIYKKGCQLGSSSSCYNLGIMYEDGEGIAADPKSARTYYQKACDLDNESACKALKK
ncbi:MAG: sel1 repeat family protein [Succinivibrio sp.]|nr:sel1 repeat family protein [Succinivibrio sp.]